MDLHSIIAMFTWTVAGAILLFLFMYLDSLFTKYKDFEEVKAGNVAATTRLVMKLGAQAYILSASMATANKLSEALVYSLLAFLMLFVLEGSVRVVLRQWAKFDLDEGTQRGHVAHGLFNGSLYIVGALIIAACF